MASQVFVSCGQASKRERDVAAHLKRALVRAGFRVYVAVHAQSIEDVNSGILTQLERSDYYIFIDFRRERIVSGPKPRFRGSIFTHQELAIAYRSGFERVLFFQETGQELEGLLRYVGGNSTVFPAGTDPTTLVLRALKDRNWRPDYLRHLVACRGRLEKQVIQTPRITGRFFFVDIENRRPDKAAYDTIARLEFIDGPGTKRVASPNRSPLKVTGQPGFSQVIWPAGHGAVDALAIGTANQPGLFLHCALDVWPISPLLTATGHYELEYAVLSRDFPLLRFTIEVELTESLETTTVCLRDTTDKVGPIT